MCLQTRPIRSVLSCRGAIGDWQQWKAFQYSCDGKIDGIDGDVDVNWVIEEQ